MDKLNEGQYLVFGRGMHTKVKEKENQVILIELRMSLVVIYNATFNYTVHISAPRLK